MSDKKSPTAKARKSLAKPADGSPVLLSGGNPQIAKGTGEAVVQSYIAAMPEWKHDIGRRLDDIVTRTVPDVKKSVKWNSPFYGMDDKSWFTSFHCMTKYIKVAFPMGTSLTPMPPGTSKQATVRYLDIYEGDDFEAEFAEWVKQASQLPGERF